MMTARKKSIVMMIVAVALCVELAPRRAEKRT